MEKLKVFLVEDEFVVREGIKNNIPWSSRGYVFCGEASDGELALPMIQKLQPDIVITDIKMPFMDGLTLSKLLKKEMPWIEIIILTGYAEFDYAREAIRLGIAEYLTKPINSDDLLKEVDQLANRINEKRKERELREMYRRDMEENSLREKKELFQEMVSGKKPVAELLEMSSKVDVNLSAMWYNIALVIVENNQKNQTEYSNRVVEIGKKVKNVLEDMDLVYFDRHPEGNACLFKADSLEELEQSKDICISRIRELFDSYEHIHYFVGIGKPVNRLTELRNSFEAANHAFAHRYLVNESRILDSRNIEQNNVVEKENFYIENVNPKQLNNSRFKNFLKVGNPEEVSCFLDEFINTLNDNKDIMQSNLFRQYLTVDAYFSVAEFIEELGYSKNEIQAPDVSNEIWQGKEKAMGYIIGITEKAMELREKAANNQYGHLSDQIKTYIEESYADEQLSLNLVAEKLNFSPNHLSSIFSQQTGQTFTKYLTDYRMNKAKELLRCTGKRSSEISAEVGYKDAHYFSYLFKKTQNMTPTQYRTGDS